MAETAFDLPSIALRNRLSVDGRQNVAIEAFALARELVEALRGKIWRIFGRAGESLDLNVVNDAGSRRPRQNIFVGFQLLDIAHLRSAVPGVQKVEDGMAADKGVRGPIPHVFLLQQTLMDAK